LQEYKYSVFGDIVEEMADSIENPFTFTAREQDQEVNLLYFRYRYYDPTIGRFMGEDPLEFSGGDLNIYRYVWNSSPNAVDPYGDVVAVAISLSTVAVVGVAIIGTAALIDLFNKFQGKELDLACPIGFLDPVLDIPIVLEKRGSKSKAKPTGRHSPEQEKIVEEAKRAKKRGGVSEGEARDLVEAGKKAGFENTRGPETHGKPPHIHVGPVNHIPVK
jgi:RHS repeat-associated protein